MHASVSIDTLGVPGVADINRLVSFPLGGFLSLFVVHSIENTLSFPSAKGVVILMTPTRSISHQNVKTRSTQARTTE